MLKTVKETQKLLNCSRSTVYKLINEGKLTRVKVLGATRITADSIAALIKSSVSVQSHSSGGDDTAGCSRANLALHADVSRQ
jgi:excisionase family DNA binding protein